MVMDPSAVRDVDLGHILPPGRYFHQEIVVHLEQEQQGLMSVGIQKKCGKQCVLNAHFLIFLKVFYLQTYHILERITNFPHLSPPSITILTFKHDGID